jgi:uncharacterized protein (TIGR00255 family)
MIQSMTGFGNSANNNFAVEIRSLNHRFIDISVKMPPYMSRHEMPLRNLLREKFQRGRFDVSVSARSTDVPRLKIDRALARNIYSALKDLQNEFSLPGAIGIETLAAYKEMLVEEEPEYNEDSLYAAFREAISNLETMRLREGKLLEEEMRNRIFSLSEMHKQIKLRAPDQVSLWRERFRERLSLIVGAGSIDDNRVLQEAAIMAEKLDISEETSRIENHIKQFTEVLGSGNVVGKKLDFLLQEISREVNTLSCKSGDYSISSLAVDMKNEIEKMREQVQNIQ